MAGHNPGVLMSVTLSDSYEINLDTNCPSRLPSGCRFIGTLNSDSLGTGILVQVMSSGMYALLSGNFIILLDQLAIERELNKLNGIDDELDEEKPFLFDVKKSLFRNIDDEIDLN